MISTKIEEFYQGKSLSIAIQDGEYAGQTIRVCSNLFCKEVFVIVFFFV